MSKRRRSASPSERVAPDDPQSSLRSTLHVQAFEATVIRSQPDAAARVTTKERDGQPGGLIRWLPDGLDDAEEIWVDRFDARLLLSSLPTNNSNATSSTDPVAQIGWDDLPSDSEDTFFMSEAEIETYQVEKRQRDMEANRQKRMQAFEEREAAERDPNDPAGWGGSDEEPDEAVRTLMERTASAIKRSPNPQQLEMRILANHGSHPRFAFLRGRWIRTWALVKNPPPPPPVAKPSTSLNGLGDYGDDSDSENEGPQPDVPEPVLTQSTDIPAAGGSISHSPVDDAAQAQRRARAKLWAEQRRQNLAGNGSG